MTPGPGTEEVRPDPGALIESMRAFGYSLPTAVADLVDNSISAGAREITVRFAWAGSHSTMSVIDDGRGMDESELVAAMRLGSRSPIEARDPKDLGRFGLGMKSAAWSQARILTVISRSVDAPVRLRRWDLDHVTATRRWELQSHGSPVAGALADELEQGSHGTAVLLESPDRMVGDVAIDDERARRHFFAGVEAVAQHLSVVFHRFLTGANALRLGVGDQQLLPWDPFLENHAATQPLEPETLWQAGHPVTVSPFVLPHHSRLDGATHRRAAGPGGWNSQQGFYVYRARRLLVAGGWLGLPRMQREEHFKLARIRIDLDNAVDGLWQIDVRKARARIPGPLQADLQRIAKVARGRASDVYRFRGKLAAREPGRSAALNFVWQPHVKRGGRVFRINRDHPVLASLREGGVETARSVETALRLVEEHLPVEGIVMESLEQARHPATSPYAGAEPEVDRMLRATLDAMIDAGVATATALVALAAAEPFDEFPHIVELLREEIDREH